MWDIERPTDYPRNARKWSKQAIAKVADSIRAYGFRQPVVVDKHGVICIGHLRRAAALGDGDHKGATFEHVKAGRLQAARDAIVEEAHAGD